MPNLANADTSHLMDYTLASDFVDELCRRAEQHRALQHPYLCRLASGQLPDVVLALQEFSFQYAFYNLHYLDYLKDVIDLLEDIQHKEKLTVSLREEEGIIGENAYLSHQALFKIFQQSLGVDKEYHLLNQPSESAIQWQASFTRLCRSGNPARAVGAVGLGTDYISPTVYQHLVKSVERFTTLYDDEFAFLKIHAEPSSEHGTLMRQVTEEMAGFLENRYELEAGMWEALELRAAFYDDMLERALGMPESEHL